MGSGVFSIEKKSVSQCHPAGHQIAVPKGGAGSPDVVARGDMVVRLMNLLAQSVGRADSFFKTSVAVPKRKRTQKHPHSYTLTWKLGLGPPRPQLRLKQKSPPHRALLVDFEFLDREQYIFTVSSSDTTVLIKAWNGFISVVDWESLQAVFDNLYGEGSAAILTRKSLGKVVGEVEIFVALRRYTAPSVSDSEQATTVGDQLATASKLHDGHFRDIDQAFVVALPRDSEEFLTQLVRTPEHEGRVFMEPRGVMDGFFGPGAAQEKKDAMTFLWRLCISEPLAPPPAGGGGGAPPTSALKRLKSARRNAWLQKLALYVYVSLPEDVTTADLPKVCIKFDICQLDAALYVLHVLEAEPLQARAQRQIAVSADANRILRGKALRSVR